MICERMHWTYQEYLDQPKWLIESLAQKSEGEAEYQKTQDDLMRQKHGS